MFLKLKKFSFLNKPDVDGEQVFNAISMSMLDGQMYQYSINCVVHNGNVRYVFRYVSNFRGTVDNSIECSLVAYRCFCKTLSKLSGKWKSRYYKNVKDGVYLNIYSKNPFLKIDCSSDFPDNIADFYKLLNVYFGMLRTGGNELYR